MGDKYAECHKTHKHLDGKSDGCQEFIEGVPGVNCGVCGCHRNFHRKVEVVYTKCHKIHNFGSQVSVDGCQEFKPGGRQGTLEALKCALCRCDKGFHRNEITTYT